MTLAEALKFFATYGNISVYEEKLRDALPTLTCGQLRAAAEYALNTQKQPKELVEAACIAIIWREESW